MPEEHHEPATLRSHWQAVKKLAEELQNRHEENRRGNCIDGCGVWRCADRYVADELLDHAVAALATLDNADDLLDDIRLECGSNTFGGVRNQSAAIKALNALLGDPSEPTP